MTDRKQLFNHELNKTKKIFYTLVLSTIILQLICFAFFSVIGKFEADGDELLRNFQSIHSLSSTVAMSGIAIIASIIIRPIVAKPYMKSSITRTFLYPIKRSELFLAKICSCGLMLFFASLFGFLFCLLCQLGIGMMMDVNSIPLNQEIIKSLIDIVSTCLLILSIVGFSQLVGIKQQSEIAIIVTATIGIIVLGNVSAIGLINYSLITGIISIVILGCTALSVRLMGDRIDQMELR